MKVREALSRLQDWRLADLVEFHNDQQDSYSLEQFLENLERLKDDAVDRMYRQQNQERLPVTLGITNQP